LRATKSVSELTSTHHAGAGGLAQFLDHRCGDFSHRNFSLYLR
jgi:hypothetical protein